MPGIERVFWGWDSPVLPKAARVLMDRAESCGMLLSDCVILVPSAEAGRRLREAMARAAGEEDRAISMPYVWHPEMALTWGMDRRRLASTLQERLAWGGVLARLRGGECESLFPALAETPDASWALSVADTLVNLRQLLGAGGHTMASVAQAMAGHTEEERWRDLTKLEEQYLAALEEQDLADLQASKMKLAEAAALPDGVTHVLVFAVADPPGLLRTWLERAAEKVEVHLHVQAPERYAGSFDDFGIPRSEAWGGHVPSLQRDLDERCLWLAPRPQDQARLAVQLVRQCVAQGLAPAVGACDPEIGDHLVSAFLAEKVQAYDPADRLALEHGLVGLIRAWMAFAESGAWKPLAAFLRLDDVLQAVLKPEDAAAADEDEQSSARPEAWSATSFLRALDDALARHLPPTLSEALLLLKDEKRFGRLRPVLEQVEAQWRHWRAGGCEAAVRGLLEWIYGARVFETHREADAEIAHLMGEAIFIASRLDEATTQMGTPFPLPDLCALFLAELEATPLSDTRGEVDLVLHGWLELLWESAPGLVITGFNEDHVPGIMVSHPFLPDSLRHQLGLASQATRRARDSYLLAAMIEQRREKGVVHAVLGKVDSDNNALKPSRLLFNCPDAALPGRIRRLFPGGEETPEEPEPAWRQAWLLKPRRETPDIATISVSGLNAYLACPFRYYIGHVLGSGEVDPTQRELSAQDFGELVHAVLAAYARHEVSRTPRPEREIAEWLEQCLEQMAGERFGARPFFSVTLQIESIRQRLKAAAGELAKLPQGGWRIVGPEMRIAAEWNLTLGDAVFVGRIDRLDVREDKDGKVYRIWDYKTGSRPPRSYVKLRNAEAEDASQNWQCLETADGRTFRWKDLQLPLYAWAVRSHFPDAVRVEAAYLMLSADSGSAEVKELKEEVGEEAIGDAVRCAEEVVRRIQGGVFWPPSPEARYDDAAALWLGNDPATAVDPAWMDSLKHSETDEVVMA